LGHDPARYCETKRDVFRNPTSIREVTVAPKHNHTVSKSAVIYVRVSSADQAREGYSIPAQLGLLRKYAAETGYLVPQEFVDVETAKQAGRSSFGEMLEYLKKHRDCQTILADKTDRLTRNIRDWVQLDELGVELHLVREHQVVGKDSKANDKLMFGVQVLMAKYYLENLSQEVRKGMNQKAAEGMWPSCAPTGYRNVLAEGGKRVIEPDPQMGAVVTELFRAYATGAYSLAKLTERAAELGLRFRRSKAGTAPKASIQRILNNEMYTGTFTWKGERVGGTYAPLVDRDTWERVQTVLGGRHATKKQVVHRGHALSGLLTCGHCGCSLVADAKKGRYVYYRCSHFKGKCPDKPVRQEELIQHFANALERVQFDEATLDSAARLLACESAEVERKREEAVCRLEEKRDRIQRRLRALYTDKLDGEVTSEDFALHRAAWTTQVAEVDAALQKHRAEGTATAPPSAVVAALAREAVVLFRARTAHEQRRLLDVVVQKATWKYGALTVAWKEPFGGSAALRTRAEPPPVVGQPLPRPSIAHTRGEGLASPM
jgi:site-specific DNA recombinase